jgi:hypothetical protein
MIKKGPLIIANAIIWGAVIIATALALRGTEEKTQVLSIIGGGAAASLMVNGIGPSTKR